jgi:DNA-binding CsgD family transcriptional regulator
MDYLTVFAWALAIVLMPILFVAWLLETDSERAHRLRRSGLSQRKIAEQMGISRWKVRQLLA